MTSCGPPVRAETTALVVAHPDDEALWFSGVLGAAGRVVICFGDQLGGGAKNARRARAVAALPLPGLVNLAIPESGVRLSVAWGRARETAFGVEIADEAGRARYEANFARLKAALRPWLVGMTDVVSHNPWGEYGHPEHVQLYRAVSDLRAELGFAQWCTGYGAPLSQGFGARAAARWVARRVVPTNARLARRLELIYLRHRVWTWPVLHRWPGRETLYELGETGQGFGGEALWDCTRLRLWRWGRRHMVMGV